MPDSKEKIFTPTVVAAAQHAHDLTAGVERKWPRFTHQHHVVKLVEEPVAFAAIAGVTAGNEIFPS